jgi:hypothetical protein
VARWERRWPGPPPGRTATLAVAAADARSVAHGAVGGCVLAVLLGWCGGFTWWGCTLAAVFGALTAAGPAWTRVWAGREWLAVRHIAGTRWVRTDDLVTARARPGPGGTAVHLRDRAGRRVELRLVDLCGDVVLRRLLLTALTRAAAAGADVDAASRRWLGIPP